MRKDQYGFKCVINYLNLSIYDRDVHVAFVRRTESLAQS